MKVLGYVERQLALPGDDDTLRKRKVAAFFAGLMGIATALLFAVLYFIGGAPLLGWLLQDLGQRRTRQRNTRDNARVIVSQIVIFLQWRSVVHRALLAQVDHV